MRNPIAGVTAGSAAQQPLVPTLMALTVVSGLVDAVSYLGLGHVFTANMTGNVVVIGFALVGAPGFSVVGSSVSLAAFLAGAVCAGRLAALFEGARRAAWVRTVLLTESVLQAAATVIAFTLDDRGHYTLIAVIALAMGLRNGTVRKLAVPDMTTTVLTLTLTGLAAESHLAGGSNPRLARRTLSVVAMLAGATVGAALVLHLPLGWSILLSSVLAAATAATYRERG